MEKNASEKRMNSEWKYQDKMDKITSSPLFKGILFFIVMLVVLYLAGVMMKVMAGTVVSYKQLKTSIQQ